MTTQAVLEERKREIPLSLFPKTFHDAIQITRQLGIRYLWINSLCIIQDSKEDWAIEAAAMGGVFKNSYVTIVADKGRDTNGGCFLTDEDPKKNVYRMQFASAGRSSLYT